MGEGMIESIVGLSRSLHFQIPKYARLSFTRFYRQGSFDYFFALVEITVREKNNVPLN